MLRTTALLLIAVLAVALAGCGGGGGGTTSQPPAPPTVLLASRDTSDAAKVSLTWSAPSSTVAGYNIYREIETESTFTKIGSVPASQTTYSDTLPTFARYLTVTYHVTSTNGSAESDPAEASVFGGPPPPP